MIAAPESLRRLFQRSEPSHADSSSSEKTPARHVALPALADTAAAEVPTCRALRSLPPCLAAQQPQSTSWKGLHAPLSAMKGAGFRRNARVWLWEP